MTTGSEVNESRINISFHFFFSNGRFLPPFRVRWDLGPKRTKPAVNHIRYKWELCSGNQGAGGQKRDALCECVHPQPQGSC